MDLPVLDYEPRDARGRDWRIGLVGCGAITESHLRAYRAAGYQVVALCNPTVSKAEQRRAAFYPEAAVYASHAELLEAEELDVVDVATHPDVRAPIVEDCLRAGVHVLSQKPFVTDLDVGARLCRMADELGCKLAVNQNGRWAPHFAWMRAAVEAGLVGDVRRVEMSVEWDHSWTFGTPFDDTEHLVLFDFGIHWFDALTLFLRGRTAKSVSATEGYVRDQVSKQPMLAQAEVRYEGAAARMHFHGARPEAPSDRTLVEGTRGILVSEGPDLGRQTVRLVTSEGSYVPELVGQWFDDGFRGTMGELLLAVEEGRQPSNSARSNLDTLALAFAAAGSAKAGGERRVPGEVRRIG